METGTGGDAHSLNDIQSYLANFNKEIEGGQTFILSTADGTAVTGAEQLYADPQIYQTDDAIDAKLKIENQHSVQQLDPSLIGQPVGMVSTAIQPGSGAIYIQQAGGDGGMQVLQGSTAQATLAAAQSMQATAQPGHEAQIVSLHNAPDGTTQMVAVPQQTVDQQQMIAMQTATSQEGLVTVEENPSQVIAVQGQQEQQHVQVHQAGGQTLQAQGPDGQNVVLNANNAYQTVTIVPSEVNTGGEVSYVLIVSQPDGEQDKDADGHVDMSVYDFKEEARAFDDDEEELGSPRKAIRANPRKPAGTTTTQLMCNYCNYTSPKRYLLTRHMKTHSEERPHKCHLCDRGFKTVASLQNHVNTHTGVRPHKCKECDAAFTTSGELVRHVRYRHTYEKPHKCTECDYASVELSKLKRHMRSHTGERPYQCPHCSYASPDTYKLKRHLRIHTGEKPYECDICHTRFTQSNSLKAHKLIHTGNKPVFQCELCPTTCGRKTDLKIHVQKLHTSDRPLQCKKCGKSFPDRYTYKIHVKTHDGEKCFKCELCPYAALSQRHLESHILTHTGEKPFQCDECEQSFRQKQLLKRHKNLYHTPDYVPPCPKEKVHQCTECHKTFAHRGNLLRHMLTHDPDNPEYIEAVKREEANGDIIESEGDDDDDDYVEGIEEGEIVQGTEGIHMANINGQQVQVQLVTVGDQDNPHVYIQIGDEQVGMVETEEAEPDEEDEMEPGEISDIAETLQTHEEEVKEEKDIGLEDGEVEYDIVPVPVAPVAPVVPVVPVKRGRGRPPKNQQVTTPVRVRREDAVITEGEPAEEITPSRPIRRSSRKRGSDSNETTPVKRSRRTPKRGGEEEEGESEYRIPRIVYCPTCLNESSGTGHNALCSSLQHGAMTHGHELQGAVLPSSIETNSASSIGNSQQGEVSSASGDTVTTEVSINIADIVEALTQADDQRKKDIETCFGFGIDDEEIPPGEH